MAHHLVALAWRCVRGEKTPAEAIAERNSILLGIGSGEPAEEDADCNVVESKFGGGACVLETHVECIDDSGVGTTRIMRTKQIDPEGRRLSGMMVMRVEGGKHDTCKGTYQVDATRRRGTP